MIVGMGVDLVEVARVARSIERFGERFLERVFTPAERRDAGIGPGRDQSLAARFAAKEAVFKALGTGWAQGIAWRDVEVLRMPDGRPVLALHGVAAERARAIGAHRWLVSLSHTASMAMASVLAEGAP